MGQGFCSDYCGGILRLACADGTGRGAFSLVGHANVVAGHRLPALADFILCVLPDVSRDPYLSPAVRIQKERGQKVVSTGPYRHVRHPMYAGLVCTFWELR